MGGAGLTMSQLWESARTHKGVVPPRLLVGQYMHKYSLNSIGGKYVPPPLPPHPLPSQDTRPIIGKLFLHTANLARGHQRAELSWLALHAIALVAA